MVLGLWTEKNWLDYTIRPSRNQQKLQEESHVHQSLTNLHPDFEVVGASLKNQETTSNFDTCVQEVLREELRLQSQKILEGNTRNQAFSIPSTIKTAMYTNRKFQSKDEEK